MEREDKPEMSKLCVSGCGFFGNQIFGGRCSKCFKELEQADKELSKQRYKEPDETLYERETKLASLMDEKCVLKEAIAESMTSKMLPGVTTDNSSIDEPKKNRRCHQCHKKINLLGFGCKCGHEFCAVHRYSEAHNCQFNYRMEAQEEIRKANPVVMAKKVEKI